MIENSFIKWINSFKDLSKNVDNISDLSDGLILNEICNQITPKYFDLESSRKDGLDNWIFREENIKSIIERIDEFYREEMSLNDQLSSIDTESIAHGNQEEIVKLIEVILGMAMDSENNEEVVENILKLDQDTQNDLMHAVSKIQNQRPTFDDDNIKNQSEDEYKMSSSPISNSLINNNNSNNNNHNNNNSNNSIKQSQDSSKEILILQNEIEKLKREKEELQNDLDESNIQLSQITMDRDRVLEDKSRTEENCQSLQENIIHLQKQLDESMAQTSTLNAINDETFKNEINDLHMQLEAKDKQLQDLKKKIDETNRLASENRSLRDEIDILREKAINAEATEEKLKKHQKKIEEIADLKKKIKELEEQNDTYIQQTLDLEEQLSKNNALKNQADSGKQQISTLKIEVTKLELQLKSIKEDRDSLATQLSSVEKERDVLNIKVETLRHEMEKKEDDHKTELSNLSSFTQNAAAGGGIGDEVVDSSTKERIARLERDNKRLKEVAEKSSELENQLEEANQQKEVLLAQIKEIESSSSSSIKSTSTSAEGISQEALSEIESLKLQLKEKEKEITLLKRKLEESNLSLDEIKKQLVELSTQQQQNSNGLSQDDLAKISNYDNLFSSNENLEGRLRAARNIIKDLREKLKAHQELEKLIQQKDEQINKYEVILKNKSELNEDLKKQLKEGKEESQREINLMLSAFLKIGLEMEQVKQQNKSNEPRSFLNKKRGD